MSADLTTVAITGATGFIGGHLCGLLSERYRLRALVRNASKAPRNVDAISGGLEDSTALGQLVEGVDCVVHLAGVVRGRRVAHFAPNYGGTLALIHAMEQINPTARLIQISSLAAREPLVSAYAASKRSAEVFVSESQLRWSMIRPPAVYGPGDEELKDLFKAMFRGIGIHPDNPGRTSIVHVSDLVAAIAALVANPAADFKIHEVDDGHPNGYSWAEIIDVAEQVRGARIRRVPIPRWLLQTVAVLNDRFSIAAGYYPMLTTGKVAELFHPDWVTDTSTLRESTGWAPEIDLTSGLRALLES